MAEVAHEQAKRIAKHLFTNGSGEHADRLVLELPYKKYGGGWCENAAVDVIEAVLSEYESLKS